MNYFAYGSNMLSARLHERVPSARIRGAGWVSDHVLRFHKVSADGSGKCDLHSTDSPAHVVHGAVFEIDVAEKPRLDRIEGVGQGYTAKSVQVSLRSGETVTAMTYTATRIDAALLPFRWYHALVLAGAREHALPAHYIEEIERVKWIEDSDETRTRRHLRLIV